ncbi:MAG: ribosome assembly cofactor RimP [Bacteroidales bacterium]|jgi:ribosome maturation factor RimP|nr:ribosome assembly cofactor RimP [Bacteroidales bacterium]
MNVTEIINALSSEVSARGLYIVDVSINKDNEIEVIIEKEEGIVELDDCVAMSRYFETCFDREKEDYSLTMSSAGLDQPFKVLKQYLKAVGSKVEVQLKGGRKMVAVLEAADEESITLKYSAKEAVEGKKKKELVEHVDRFTMDQVNAVRPYIEF